MVYLPMALNILWTTIKHLVYISNAKNKIDEPDKIVINYLLIHKNLIKYITTKEKTIAF